MTYKIWKDEPFDFAPTRKLGTKGWIAHKDAPAAPPPPDYVGAANATAQSNLELARVNAQANRPNQVNPWGETTWKQNTTFDQAGYDQAVAAWNDSMAKWNDPEDHTFDAYKNAGGMPVPAPDKNAFTTGQDNWTQTVTLDPKIQASLDSQLNVQTGKSQLAESMLDKLKATYGSDFNAPDLQEYLKNVGTINQGTVNTSDYTGMLEKLKTDAPEVYQYLQGVGQVNQNAPQFDQSKTQEYGKAAFDAQDAWLSPEYAKNEKSLRESLALQGLTAGSEAEQGATGSFYDSKNKAYNSLASSSLLTGAQVAQGNYAQTLAGFNAGNAAQNQAFGQGIAQQQGDLAAFSAANAARQNNYGNALNEAQVQQANQAAGNTAVEKAYAQALSKYQTQYAADYTKRTLPLNEMNALLTGQQVAAPTFQSFNPQGQTSGANINGAVAAQGDYDKGVYNAGAAATGAANAATGQAVGAIAGAAAMFF